MSRLTEALSTPLTTLHQRFNRGQNSIDIANQAIPTSLDQPSKMFDHYAALFLQRMTRNHPAITEQNVAAMPAFSKIAEQLLQSGNPSFLVKVVIPVPGQAEIALFGQAQVIQRHTSINQTEKKQYGLNLNLVALRDIFIREMLKDKDTAMLIGATIMSAPQGHDTFVTATQADCNTAGQTNMAEKTHLQKIVGSFLVANQAGIAHVATTTMGELSHVHGHSSSEAITHASEIGQGGIFAGTQIIQTEWYPHQNNMQILAEFANKAGRQALLTLKSEALTQADVFAQQLGLAVGTTETTLAKVPQILTPANVNRPAHQVFAEIIK